MLQDKGAPALRGETAVEAEAPRSKRPSARPQGRIEIVTFGFKYGRPNTNYYFDVSFLKNPARDARWTLFSKADAGMREFVLGQPQCQEFLDAAVRLVRTVCCFDDDLRVGIGCSSGRHRSRIVAEELLRRLGGDGTRIRLTHREESES